MKRALILAVGLVAVTAIAASAQTPTTPQPPAQTAVGASFVDANGDGICDNFQAGTRQGQGNSMARKGKRLGPQDGSGYGAGSGAGVGSGTGTAICDGTGPKGKGRGPRR
jgi:opacity protein-like surface antigen